MNERPIVRPNLRISANLASPIIGRPKTKPIAMKKHKASKHLKGWMPKKERNK